MFTVLKKTVSSQAPNTLIRHFNNFTLKVQRRIMHSGVLTLSIAHVTFSPQYIVEFKNIWSCASVPPYAFMAWCLTILRMPSAILVCAGTPLLSHKCSKRTDYCMLKTLKNGVLWDVTPCGSCKNRRFRRNLAPNSSE
jgi:hypothetical protein